jgi:outer membrane biosynthesis protein TonB
MKTLLTLTLLGVTLAATGCAARSAEMYRDETRKLLETKQGAIQACYDEALKASPTAIGKVVVRFTVKSDTGVISDAKVLKKQSTASDALGACVVKAIEGLKLDPPDERDGDATFSWEFQLKS